jgi:hypothetical protein
MLSLTPLDNGLRRNESEPDFSTKITSHVSTQMKFLFKRSPRAAASTTNASLSRRSRLLHILMILGQETVYNCTT